MSDKIFVNDLDLFMLSNYTETFYVIKARVLFLFTWVHYTRRMSTGIVDPQPCHGQKSAHISSRLFVRLERKEMCIRMIATE